MKLDVLLGGELADVPGRVAELSAVGVDGLFTYEGPRDVFFPLVSAAALSSLDLYTNVAVALPRSPMHLAYQAYDLHRLSKGRFRCGVGSQIKPHIVHRFGSTWNRPVSQMRDIIEAMKAIFAAFAGEAPLDFHGNDLDLTLLPPTFNPGPLEWGPPPVWGAGVGPKMTQMLGEVADGIVTHPFTSGAFITDHTMANLELGFAEAGRSRNDFTVTVGAIVATGTTDQAIEEAVANCRRLLGFYGSTPSYRVVLERHGWGELQNELRAMTKDGRWDQIDSVWEDEMVDTLLVRGTPSEAAAELTARFGAHADRVAISTPYGVETEALGLLAEALN